MSAPYSWAATVPILPLYAIGIAVTLLGGGLVYFLARSRPWQIPQRILLFFIVASGYLFFAQYFKYRSLHFYVDISHWLQLLYTISRTGLPHVLNQEFIVPGTLNYFSAHFVPLIYILAIPFTLIQRQETLIVLNVALMLSSAIPLYKLARLHSIPSLPAHLFGLFIVVLFLWYPTFQYTTLYEFEMLRFSTPILLWMLYFFETRRFLLYLFFVFLAVLVREEVGLTVAMFGVYAWLFQKRRWEGFFAIVLGFGGFALIGNVLMPLFREGQYTHIAAGEFTQFGSSSLGILGGVVRHPIAAFTMIFQPFRLVNLFMLGLPLLFIPLLAPAALLGTIASIGIGLLGGITASSYMLYYLSPGVPFIFYALLKSWPKIVARFNGVAVMNAMLVSTLLTNIFFGPSPIALQFWFKNISTAPFRTQNFHWSVYRTTEHHRKADEFIALIPEEAIVAAPQFLHPRLYNKKGTIVFTRKNNPAFPRLQSKDGKWQAEYALLDITNNGLMPWSPVYVTEEEMAIVRESKEWALVKADDGYELYRRMQE